MRGFISELSGRETKRETVKDHRREETLAGLMASLSLVITTIYTCIPRGQLTTNEFLRYVYPCDISDFIYSSLICVTWTYTSCTFVVRCIVIAVQFETNLRFNEPNSRALMCGRYNFLFGVCFEFVRVWNRRSRLGRKLGTKRSIGWLRLESSIFASSFFVGECHWRNFLFIFPSESSAAESSGSKFYRRWKHDTLFSYL